MQLNRSLLPVTALFEPELVQRLDAFRARVEGLHEGVRFSRSAVVRRLVEAALALEEAAKAVEAPRP
jgi:hypothetical protein